MPRDLSSAIFCWQTGPQGNERADRVSENLPFFTIGHSTRSLEEFVVLLQAGRVGRVVDVRTVRRSRRNPQYNEDSLPTSLAEFGLTYEAIPELGGLRKRTPEIPPDRNGFWDNRSFHNYADYALTEPFEAGLNHLLSIGREERSCIMCSEAVWWRCHRRIIADHLLARGERVFHLMGKDRVVQAKMTLGAEIEASGLVIYPRAGRSEP